MFNFFLALSLFAASANSKPKNITIDDEFGDELTGLLPIYSPAEEWSQGLTCFFCAINILEVPLDVSQIYQGTWHDATHQSGRGGGQTTITVSFTGSAVYVYHIVVNSIPDVITSTQLSFVLDGTVVGHYSHTPDSSDTILYNVPVFVSSGLENTAHTLIIQGEGLQSLLLFDYVTYTSDDGSGEAGGFSSLSSTSGVSSSTSSLLSTSTVVSTSSGTSTSSLPSISLFSSSTLNTSVTASQTPTQSFASTQSLENSSSSSPTVASFPQRNNHVSARAIVGATVGSTAALLLVCALLFFRIRRRSRRSQGQTGADIIALNIGNEPATPVDDDPAAELETDSVLEIKDLSPIWKPLVPLPSYLTRSRSASSGAAVTTVDAYGHSPESGPEARRSGPGARMLHKDIVEIREQLARFRARRGRS